MQQFRVEDEYRCIGGAKFAAMLRRVRQEGPCWHRVRRSYTKYTREREENA